MCQSSRSDHELTGSNKFFFPIRDHKNQEAVDNTLKNPQKIDDIKGNLSPKSVKMLSSLNLRNMTPLISSVDHGNYEIFRFIVELCLHI